MFNFLVQDEETDMYSELCEPVLATDPKSVKTSIKLPPVTAAMKHVSLCADETVEKMTSLPDDLKTISGTVGEVVPGRV